MKLKIWVLAAALTALSSAVPAAEAVAPAAKAGQTVFKKCMACHSAIDAKNKVGPSLMGIVGRKVGSIAGYKYSPALVAFAAPAKVWDEATLTAYLANPKAVIPKGKMAFAGLKKPEDVAAVIAYLKNPAAVAP